VVSYTLR